MNKGQAYGCGQCLPCRINKRREWTHRIIIESHLHEHASFVTLTYSDDHLPECNSLQPRDTRNFLKRLRKASLHPIRYFIVGEYGELTHRPHYHGALYGVRPCENGVTHPKRCCETCSNLERLWGHGRIYVGRLEPDSAAYIAGYTVKKMTRKDDPRLDGRHPEFARMSLKPGIGADYMDEVASTVLQYNIIETHGDVPGVLQHGKKKYPLGRYLKKRLRIRCGLDGKATVMSNAQMETKMQPLRVAAKENSRSLRQEILAQNLGARINIETREKLRSRKDTL